MTKQEEIREGIDLILDNLVEGNKIRTSTDGIADLYRDKILSYLHSQGVVIDMGDRWDEDCKCYSKKVEPLIRREDD